MIVRSARPGGTLTLRPEIAASMVLAGVMLGMIALGAGVLWPGMTGLVLIGLGIGFIGSPRQRVLVAVLIWLAATGLAMLGMALGRIGFEITAPVVVSLVVVALGQVVGMMAGVVSGQSTATTAEES